MNAVHIVVAMKPVDCSNVDNAIERGVAGLNIEGSRIGTTVETWPASRNYSSDAMSRPGSTQAFDAETQKTGPAPAGRWPANVIIDDSKEVAAQFPVMAKQGAPKKKDTADTGWFGGGAVSTYFGDEGSAARFFKECKT